MRGVECLRAGDLLERRASGLRAGERLRLEEHLGRCPACASDASMLSHMRMCVLSESGELSAEARERAITQAFRVARQTEAPRKRSHDALRSAGFALAAAVALLMGYGAREVLVREEPAPQAALGTRADGSAAQAATASGGGAAADAVADVVERRVLMGRIETDDGVLQAGQAIAAGVAMHAPEGARLQLGRAHVTLRPDSRVRYLSSEGGTQDRLELTRGSVLCEVEPRDDGRRFAVVTRHLTALVLGTRFEVAPTRVRVYEGHVRVVGADGRVLAESLGAGEQVVLDLPAGKRARASDKARRATPGERPDPAELLGQARRQLASGEHAQGRATVERALRLARAKPLRAEALTLRAEAQQLSGQPRAALRTYLAIASHYGNLAAGENALFAAGRVQAKLDPPQARGLFERYLARYPNGRFVDEAHARLRRMAATSK